MFISYDDNRSTKSSSWFIYARGILIFGIIFITVFQCSEVMYSCAPPSSHGRAKARRPARTYIQQLCADTGCSPEDLPEAMEDREGWRKRIRDVRADSVTWWWWWWCFNAIEFDNSLIWYVDINSLNGSQTNTAKSVSVHCLDVRCHWHRKEMLPRKSPTWFSVLGQSGRIAVQCSISLACIPTTIRVWRNISGYIHLKLFSTRQIPGIPTSRFIL